MDFKGVAPSRNYINDWNGVARIMDALRNPGQVALDQAGSGVGAGPNAYGNWLVGSFQNMTPEEFAMMRRNRLTVQDINTLQQMQHGDVRPVTGLDLLNAYWSKLLHK